MGDYSQSEALAEADGLIDYIQLLFLTDLGEGHMETFDQGEKFDFEIDLQIESSTEIIPFVDVLINIRPEPSKYVYQTNYIDDVPIVRQYFLSHIDFRGPPVQA